ncbi:MAG: hypothetical protein WA299_16200, partial [Candidatus Acidiferrum sp.]
VVAAVDAAAVVAGAAEIVETAVTAGNQFFQIWKRRPHVNGRRLKTSAKILGDIALSGLCLSVCNI